MLLNTLQYIGLSPSEELLDPKCQQCQNRDTYIWGDYGWVQNGSHVSNVSCAWHCPMVEVYMCYCCLGFGSEVWEGSLNPEDRKKKKEGTEQGE